MRQAKTDKTNHSDTTARNLRAATKPSTYQVAQVFGILAEHGKTVEDFRLAAPQIAQILREIYQILEEE